jgi:hypothetical protein
VTVLLLFLKSNDNTAEMDDTYFTGPEDFHSWNIQFFLKANGLLLWTYVRPVDRLPWPVEPKMPDFKAYEKMRVAGDAKDLIDERRSLDNEIFGT